MFDTVYTLSFGEVIAWGFVVAVVFTIVGMRWQLHGIIEATIDSLVNNGYLRHRKNSTGEIEILKLDEELE